MPLSSESENKPHRPAWLKVRLPNSKGYFEIKRLAREKNLHTVCEEARCPNISECWGKRTATFMILGEVCTRACRFCAVKTGLPKEYDLDEPRRVAEAVKTLNIRHAVITSVDRDDLPDQGAFIFAETIRRIRASQPETRIEVLTPDFHGSVDSLRTVLEASPDVFAHNVETVPRLYRTIRPGARFAWSTQLLAEAKRLSPQSLTKSSVMVGLGESREELIEVMKALQSIQVNILTLGQYLQPTREHAPVQRFYPPEEFRELKFLGESMGIPHVEAGPLVRSSYHAETQVVALTGSSVR
ncbi:MAG: lipoyl synthase [Acidobacteriia bacterium]|nr:lipoyl synthase [Terriglobia bacterium]